MRIEKGENGYLVTQASKNPRVFEQYEGPGYDYTRFDALRRALVYLAENLAGAPVDITVYIDLKPDPGAEPINPEPILTTLGSTEELPF